MVSAEGLEQGGVGVGPPLGGVPHGHVDGVLEAVELGKLVEGVHELALRPRLVDRGDGDTGLVEGGLAAEEAQRGVVRADGVELVVPDSLGRVDDLVLEILGNRQRREVPGPGPVRHDRAVEVKDVGQVAGDGRGGDGVVIGLLREGLHRDLGVGVGGVEVLDRAVDDVELLLVAPVVGPQRDAAGGGAGALAGLGGAGSERGRDGGGSTDGEERATGGHHDGTPLCVSVTAGLGIFLHPLGGELVGRLRSDRPEPRLRRRAAPWRRAG